MVGCEVGSFNFSRNVEVLMLVEAQDISLHRNPIKMEATLHAVLLRQEQMAML